MEFLLQPNVYSTSSAKSLLDLLDNMWLKAHTEGAGTLYIVSGFSNYNGGVRFYPYFTRHTVAGGKIVVFVGGSTAQRLSSRQVVEALLQCGAEVYVVNRKRLLHAKCYGYKDNQKEELIVTSGNFTGPGMSQNAEAALRIESDAINAMGFEWEVFINSIRSQKWDIYNAELSDIQTKKSPVWKLLYDEFSSSIKLDES